MRAQHPHRFNAFQCQQPISYNQNHTDKFNTFNNKNNKLLGYFHHTTLIESDINGH